LSHRLALDSLAGGTLGIEKTGDGLQALRWYKQGKLVEIAEYCCYDVKITRLLHQYGAAHQRLFYLDRRGQPVPVPVSWKL
jgi:DEAD/DEAH box helicase domain-containing protein